MRTNAKFIETDNYEIEMTIRMTAAEWDQLKDQLVIRWPSSKLAEHVSFILRKLDQQVQGVDKVDP